MANSEREFAANNSFCVEGDGIKPVNLFRHDQNRNRAHIYPPAEIFS